MKLRKIFYIFLLILVFCKVQIYAQLNAPETILLDSLSIYPEFGIQSGDGYIIGGEEGSCEFATIWRLDGDFNIIDQRQFRHMSYEISEMLDIRWGDSTISVLTRQLQYDDVGGDEGVKWYSLNTNFEILDSLYLPNLDAYDGILLDTTWILKTWQDSLMWVNGKSGQIDQQIYFDENENDLIVAGEDLLTWKENTLYKIDASHGINSVVMSTSIRDITVDSGHIYVLNEDQIRKLEWMDGVMFLDSVPPPPGSQVILMDPVESDLVVITDSNQAYFYDALFQPISMVQLFYDPVYREDLHYTALEDGSILRLGFTRIETEISELPLYGQEFGMIHRFDSEYSEANFNRPDLNLHEVILKDPYYGADGIAVSGDTTYIITKDVESQFQWDVVNTGGEPVHSGVVATNILYGFNCFRWANTFFVHDTILNTSDSLIGEFEVYEISDFPDGWQENRIFYTAFPNGHYDANFSDNFRTFSLRYIISNTRNSLNPELVKIWPNPTKGGALNIRIPAELSIENASVVNLQGRIIYTQKMGIQGESSIHLPEMPAGTYFLQLRSADQFLVKMFSVVP